MKSNRNLRLVALAAGLAVIIIALAVVASGVAFKPAPPPVVEAPVPAKPKAVEFVWHSEPRDMPLTVFKDKNDADRTLKDFAGKVLVVNFWATWCAPCVKEMPTLDRLQAKLGGPSLQVLTISQDREGARVAGPFKDKNNWPNLDLYVEPSNRFARDASLVGLPTSLIIDKNGKEVARVEGEVEWDSPEVEKMLRPLMDAS